MVLDADGINLAARHISVLKTVRAPLIITPHPGEMARLTGLSTAEVQADRENVARRFADQSKRKSRDGHRRQRRCPGRDDRLLSGTGNARAERGDMRRLSPRHGRRPGGGAAFSTRSSSAGPDRRIGRTVFKSRKIGAEAHASPSVLPSSVRSNAV